MSGYTPQEVEKVYPELKDNMDILYSLSATMKTRPISEIPALYPELFTPEQISKLQSAQQGQPTKVPNMIHQITSDVLAGMKPTDIEKNYPEMK